MQRFVVSFALVVTLVIAPASVLAQNANAVNQNQRVAEHIAGQLGSKFPSYDIHVGYTNGVVTLGGEMHAAQQVTEAVEFIRTMPGITRVINNIKVTPEFTQMQAVPVASDQTANVSSPFRSAPVPSALPQEIAAVTPATTNANNNNAIAQVSGQVIQNSVPATPAPDFTNGTPKQPMTQSQAMMPQDEYHPAPMASNTIMSSNEAVPMPMQSINTSGMPLPMGQQSPTAGRYDQPNVPNYAWPSYAAPNNYAEVNYPRLYCPQAAPYIGPFYPYPQVPMGWRKVTLEWHDGYWWLDFDDGSCNGPFSPLFRQPNPKRY